MMEEELQRIKEASQADPSIVVQPPARPPRHQKWKAARMKGDKYINADVAEVASKIDALEEQSSQGSFTPATRMDILSTAIGKPDYLDAVRGETRGVSVAKYFGRRSRCSHDDNNPSPQLVAKIRANLVDEILAQVRVVRSFMEATEKSNPLVLLVMASIHFTLSTLAPPPPSSLLRYKPPPSTQTKHISSQSQQLSPNALNLTTFSNHNPTIPSVPPSSHMISLPSTASPPQLLRVFTTTFGLQ
ncbi:hypothetical protein K1719_039397 [Acacia pycnantha]|nr:hypothetical protein K1719_039397 [Acacia pycnantha]